MLEAIRLSETRVLRELDGIKRSILYDAQARADEVKNTVLLNSVSSLTTNVAHQIENLGFELPLRTTEDFETFDTVIISNLEKRRALVSSL